MRLSSRLLLTALLLLSLPAAAHALDGGGWTVHPHEWYSEFSASRIYANAFFLNDSRDQALPPNGTGRFQQFQVRSYNEIGWKRNVSILLDVPFVDRTVRGDRTTLTTSGLSDLSLGLRIRLREDGPGLILEGGWQAPLGYDQRIFPALGDGRQKAWVGLNGGLRLPYVPAFVQASRGFLYIGEDAVLLSRTTVDGGMWIGSNILVGGRYADQLGWNAAESRRTLPTFYRAGPLLLVRVDDHMDVSVGAWRNLYGRNSLEGTEFYAALGLKQSKLNPLQGFLGSKLH